jgi:hypothetical protein
MQSVNNFKGKGLLLVKRTERKPLLLGAGKWLITEDLNVHGTYRYHCAYQHLRVETDRNQYEADGGQ